MAAGLNCAGPGPAFRRAALQFATSALFAAALAVLSCDGEAHRRLMADPDRRPDAAVRASEGLDIVRHALALSGAGLAGLAGLALAGRSRAGKQSTQQHAPR